MSAETTYSGLGAAFSGIVEIQSSVEVSSIIAGSVILTDASGGTQFPSNVLTVGVGIANVAEQSGGGTTNNVLIGGLNGNAPYYDPTIFPPFNGVFIGQIAGTVGSNSFIPVKNTNELRAVVQSGLSGVVALRYFGY